MQVSISTADNNVDSSFGTFPPNLLRFRMDASSPFYTNDDYIYEFKTDGEHRTSPRPLGFRPSMQELDRQTFLAFKALFRPKIERPPADIKELAERIAQTNLIDPEGDLDGIVWPIRFTSKWELHVIKLPTMSVKELEEAVLNCILAHFGVSVDQIDIQYR